MRAIIIGAGAMALTGCATEAKPLTDDQRVEQFMWGYTQAWNRHDAATIARDFYRMGRTVEEQTAATKKGFDDLVAQGYDKSDIHEIKGCVTGPDTAWAGMKFTRMTKDGGFLPPKDRASSYELKKFPDGWRITRLTGYDVTKPLACPAKPG
jgi:hypothetical protein